jgi:rubrerythrin
MTEDTAGNKVCDPNLVYCGCCGYTNQSTAPPSYCPNCGRKWGNCH